MEVEEKSKKRNYGKMGCFIAVILLVIVIILVATGVINYSWEQ
jgi:flagellar basal body-associated protein FliL